MHWAKRRDSCHSTPLHAVRAMPTAAYRSIVCCSRDAGIGCGMTKPSDKGQGKMRSEENFYKNGALVSPHHPFDLEPAMKRRMKLAAIITHVSVAPAVVCA